MKPTLLTPSKIDEYLSRCIGKRVSTVWNGYGTALFLELGRLHRVPPLKGNKKRSRGNVTLMIEWSWRIEAPRSIVVGSFDTERRIQSKPQILKGQRITDIAISCRLPEISIAFSNKNWLHSFATEAGQPEWALIFRGEGSVFVRRGRIHFIKEEN